MAYLRNLLSGGTRGPSTLRELQRLSERRPTKGRVIYKVDNPPRFFKGDIVSMPGVWDGVNKEVARQDGNQVFLVGEAKSVNAYVLKLEVRKENRAA